MDRLSKIKRDPLSSLGSFTHVRSSFVFPSPGLSRKSLEKIEKPLNEVQLSKKYLRKARENKEGPLLRKRSASLVDVFNDRKLEDLIESVDCEAPNLSDLEADLNLMRIVSQDTELLDYEDDNDVGHQAPEIESYGAQLEVGEEDSQDTGLDNVHNHGAATLAQQEIHHIPVNNNVSVKALRLKPMEGESQDLARARFSHITEELGLSLTGRVITMTNPSSKLEDLSKKSYTDFIFHLIMEKEGDVLVLPSLPTCMGPKFTRPVSAKTLKTQSFNSYVYVRSKRAYWLKSDRSIDGLLVHEIPSSLVIPTVREGYITHLYGERSEDFNVPKFKANPKNRDSIRKFEDLKIQALAWRDSDPVGLVTFAESLARQRLAFENASVSKPPLESADASTFAESLDRQGLASENASGSKSLLESADASMEVEDDSSHAESNSRASDAETEPESGVGSSVEDRRISFMVDKPFEDSNSPPECNPFIKEFIKIRPYLNACSKCGDPLHKVLRCPAQSADEKTKSIDRYQNCAWFCPDAGSLAAKGGDGIISCIYPYCRTPGTHSIIVCPSLHQRCETCRVRGHDDQDSRTQNLKGYQIKVNCPLKKERFLEEKDEDLSGVDCPDWEALQLTFEKYADHGLFTRYRLTQPAAGWYPIWSEKEARILRQIGHRWLGRVSADKAVHMLTIISQTLRATFSQGPSFQVFSDEDWTLINRRRDAKRSVERIETAKYKAAKRAEWSEAKSANNSPWVGRKYFKGSSGQPMARPSIPGSGGQGFGFPPRSGGRDHSIPRGYIHPEPRSRENSMSATSSQGAPAHPVRGTVSGGASSSISVPSGQYRSAYPASEYAQWDASHEAAKQGPGPEVVPPRAMKPYTIPRKTKAANK